MKSQATHHSIFCSDCLSGDFSRRQEENQAGGRFLVSPRKKTYYVAETRVMRSLSKKEKMLLMDSGSTE